MNYSSLLVPPIVFVVILLIWFFVPSAPVCDLFNVGQDNCSSWTSGLFGVGIGGVLTLWASWFFGDKSSKELAEKLDEAVQQIIKDGTDRFVNEVNQNLEAVKQDLMKGLPQSTASSIKSDAIASSILVLMPTILKMLPGVAGAAYDILTDDQKKQLEEKVKQSDNSSSGEG